MKMTKDMRLWRSSVKRCKELLNSVNSASWEIADNLVNIATVYGTTAVAKFAKEIGMARSTAGDYRTTALCWPRKSNRPNFEIAGTLNPMKNRYEIVAKHPHLTVEKARNMVRNWRIQTNKPYLSIYKYSKIAAKELDRITSDKNRLYQVLQLIIKNKRDPDFSEFGQAGLLNKIEQAIERLEGVHIALANKRYKASRAKFEKPTKREKIHAQA
jgi:hypothetical protein